MSEDVRSPDEWAPPPLSTHFPFPILALIGVGFRDGFTVGVAVLLGSTAATGFGEFDWFPTWWDLAWHLFVVAYVLNMLIRPQGTRLLSWLMPWLRHVVLAFVVRWAWGGHRMYEVARRRAGVTGRLTILLPRSWARLVHADVRVEAAGIIDVSGGLGPSWLRWLFATARRQETLRGLVWLSMSGSLDLVDSDELVAMWQNRLALLADPGHSLSLHGLVRAFPADLLAVSAGPVAAEAAKLAESMVRRDLVLAVPASRRAILSKRLAVLLGTGRDNENGLLAAAGLDSRMLTLDETKSLVADAYGGRAGPAVWYSPRKFSINTGVSDPPALSDADQPVVGVKGWQGYRTYAISGMPSRVKVGWTYPVTGGSVLANWSVHLGHIPHIYAEGVLGLKSAAWWALRMGRQKYERAARLTDQTLDLLRTRDTAVWDVSMYVSVPVSQVPEAERAIERMVGRGNFFAPALAQQQARMAAEPFGRDPCGVSWWGDSHTIAAGWPSSGGIYVPGGLFIGKCARSDEPIVWNPQWAGDETSVGCILGGSGSGKTNEEQAIAAEWIAPHPEHWLYGRPHPVVVAYYKPFNEWAAFVEHFGGRHYRVRDADWRELLDAAPVGASPIVAFNLMDLGYVAQTEFLRWLSDRVMAVQELSQYVDPLLYIVGEAWLMARSRKGAEHLQQMALQVRTLGITLLVDSQFADHLYRSPEARDVIRGASMWTLLRLNPSERRDLGELLSISPTGMQFLAQVAQPQTLSGGRAKVRGRGLIHAHGLTTTVQVLRLGFLAQLLDETNPRLRVRKERTNGHADPGDSRNGLVLRDHAIPVGTPGVS